MPKSVDVDVVSAQTVRRRTRGSHGARLSRSPTGRVALDVPWSDRWFYSTIAASIDAELARADLDVLLYKVDGEQQCIDSGCDIHHDDHKRLRSSPPQ